MSTSCVSGTAAGMIPELCGDLSEVNMAVGHCVEEA